MPKPSIYIDLPAMQAIINKEENLYKGGMINFLDHCATLYNKENNPATPLYGQLIYLRINKGVLHTNFQKTKGVSQEQLQAMKAGREKAKNNRDTVTNNYFNGDLQTIVDQINSAGNTDYKLKLNGKSGALKFSKNKIGPSLPYDILKWWLRGFANGLGVDVYSHELNLTND